MQCLKRKPEEKKDFLLLMSIIIMNLCFFFLIGERGYIEMRDTASYCLPNLTEGIMPVYPFLINSFRILFSENYLTAVSVFQGFLAAFCITVFLMFLKKKFALKYGEIYLLWTATVLPFAIELPRYVLTHVIYTEGITYSLFYIYVMLMLNTLFEKKKRWFLMTFIMSVFMGLIRPQLMLLLILTCFLLMYRLFLQKGKRWSLKLIMGAIASVVLISVGVVGIFQIRTFYMNNIGVKFDEEKNEEQRSGVQKLKKVDSLGQVGSALICRAFYEADAEDYRYYEDMDMQEMFLRIYWKCDRERILYPYAKKGLWMWEDLTQTDIYHIASYEIEDFLSEKYPHMVEGELSQRISQVKISMAVKEICLHFGRFVYHCIRLMIPGFIACIFFNIEGIYSLCHIIVLFLYISAIVMAICVLKKKELNNDVAKFMLASILSCIVFVGVVNGIFFGMQRYFIYNMGVFYCAYYLTFREICSLFLKKKG